jgi:hypothetical protein
MRKMREKMKQNFRSDTAKQEGLAGGNNSKDVLENSSYKNRK